MASRMLTRPVVACALLGWLALAVGDPCLRWWHLEGFRVSLMLPGMLLMGAAARALSATGARATRQLCLWMGWLLLFAAWILARASPPGWSATGDVLARVVATAFTFAAVLVPLQERGRGKH